MPTAKVLIVDDDFTVLGILSSYLKRNGGYEVRTTSNPQEALEISRNDPVDLLIADIMMPGMLGPKLFQEIKLTSPKAACIFISGYERDMYNLPSDILFLSKPVESVELFSTIEKALAQSGQTNTTPAP